MEIQGSQAAEHEAHSIRPQFITFEGLKVRVALSPKAEAETVVLLSPMPESLYAFLPIWSKLAAHFSLLAVDLPGFGQSDGDPSLMTPQAMGEFIVRLCREFGIEHAHGIGPDIGTSALLAAAATHPAYFHSLIIGSGATSTPLKVDSLLKDFISADTAENFSDVDIAAVVTSLFEAMPDYNPPQHVLDDYKASYAGRRFVECLAYVRSYPASLPALNQLLGSIQTPVQIIVGRNDPFVSLANGEELDQALPHSELTVLNCGHLPWEEDHHAYGEIANEWMAGRYQTV
ncbi:alpha/beta fold hydrolase [Streptomyces sp. NPDC059215]|uniref:alpha/beta fold hydrolase n=1 Tax=Streptomyces sp. NPDC059215 TaxID=3346772 RepID=UPI0036C0EF06